MPNIQPVLFIIGVLFVVLSVFMVLPLLAGAFYGNSEEAYVFLFSAGVTALIGAILIFTQRQSKITRLTVRQGFLATALSWISLCFAASLPLYMSPAMSMSLTNALFEATSGLTTTGATVIDNLENTPQSILLWRSLLQWLGGVGILATALIALPLLQIGGMQLFRMEFTETVEKALPRPAQIGFSILAIYIFLTLLCALMYWLSGMGLFDAVNHAMTTVSTGGYSTHDLSMGWFDSPQIQSVAVLFMILGSLPFLLFFDVIRGNIKKLIMDSQVQVFLLLLVISWGMLYFYLHYRTDYGESLIDIIFNTTSVFTGTGYSTGDYSAWGGFALMSFFFMMLIGGCSGSTTCGLKIFRLQVLYSAARVQMLQLARPNGVFIMGYQGRRLSRDVVQSVMGFLFLYVLSFGVLAVLLGSTGLDFMSAASASASAIGNVGPGLGSVVGPSVTFSGLTDSAKWLMSVGMVIGRLELFTIYVFFLPSFWRK